jgi:AraC family cel operon transcriptional repressor
MRLLLSRFINDPSRAYAGIISAQKQLAFRHSHDYFEFFVVYRGTGIHRINGASRMLEKGTVVLVRPDDLHYYVNLSPDFAIINVLIPSGTIQALFEYLGPGFESRRLLSTRYPPSSRVSPTVFKTLVTELEKLVLSKRLLKGRSDAYFRITLLNLLVTCFPMGPTGSHTDLPVWLRWLALEMMKVENLTEGLPAMRRLSGKSEEHLSRACRKFLHHSPTEFINELRLEHSARLIMDTNEKIIDICSDAGFESLSYYYRLFRKRFGMAPGELRRRAGSLNLEESLLGSTTLDMGIPPAVALEATGRADRRRSAHSATGRSTPGRSA